jgi:hypothetical protein
MKNELQTFVKTLDEEEMRTLIKYIVQAWHAEQLKQDKILKRKQKKIEGKKK